MTGVPVAKALALPDVPEEHQDPVLAALLPATFVGTTASATAASENEETANENASDFTSAFHNKKEKGTVTRIANDSKSSESNKSHRSGIDPPAAKKTHSHRTKKTHSHRTSTNKTDSSRRLSSQGSDNNTGLGKHLIWALVAVFVVVVVAAAVVAVILVSGSNGDDDDDPEPTAVPSEDPNGTETTVPGAATTEPTSEIVEEESNSNKETKVYLFIIIPAASCLLLPLCAACWRKNRSRPSEEE